MAKVTIEFGLIAIAHNFLKQVEKTARLRKKIEKITKPTEKIHFLRGF
ncbi:hypothetical protein ACQVUL_14170 [Bacillus cytotoxicus]|nr:hypothetical protein [Bacillus cytotoxicus]